MRVNAEGQVSVNQQEVGQILRLVVVVIRERIKHSLTQLVLVVSAERGRPRSVIFEHIRGDGECGLLLSHRRVLIGVFLRHGVRLFDEVV